jgi:hypothetical protein
MHTMTKRQGKSGTIDVKALVAEDEEFLRALVRTALQEVLEVEMTEALGAEKGERAAGRQGYRSGYYGRTLITRVGKLELRVPQDRRLPPTDPRRRHLRAAMRRTGQTVPWGSRSVAGHMSARRAASRERPRLPSRTERSCRQQHVLHRGMIFLGLRIAGQERYQGLIPNPQRAENLPSSCAFRPQQFAGNCVFCERRLIGEAGRALRGDHTGSGTASYSFISEESGNLDIAIVVRHDLSLLAG